MLNEETILLDKIVVHPEICLGKPRIKGTRIYISIILDWLAEGASFSEIIDAYPSLNNDDIKLVLQYAKLIIEKQFMS